MKLSKALQGFELDKALTFGPNTMDGYRWAFNHLLDFLGDLEVSEIHTADIKRLLAHLLAEHQLSRRSVKDAWARLSSFWTWAEKELGIPHIIKGKIPEPKYTKRKIETFSQEDIRAMLVAAEYTKAWTTKEGKQVQTKRPTADRDKAIVLTLLDTGARASELCALTIADYDERRGRLRIQHGKGDKERYVVVGTRTKKAIWRYLADRTSNPKAPLFATQQGEPISRDVLYRLIVSLGTNAGVKNAHPHRFRHTFAVNFLRNGGNVPVLKELLGHERMDTILIYVRIAELDVDSAARFSVADNWKI